MPRFVFRESRILEGGDPVDLTARRHVVTTPKGGAEGLRRAASRLPAPDAPRAWVFIREHDADGDHDLAGLLTDDELSALRALLRRRAPRIARRELVVAFDKVICEPAAALTGDELAALLALADQALGDQTPDLDLLALRAAATALRDVAAR